MIHRTGHRLPGRWLPVHPVMGDAGVMRIIIDTDPGMGTPGADPEDGMAILYALRSPGVTIEGITLVQGNVAVSHAEPMSLIGQWRWTRRPLSGLQR